MTDAAAAPGSLQAPWRVSDVLGGIRKLTAEQHAQLDKWKQGHVIEDLPPLWLAPGYDLITEQHFEGSDPNAIVPVLDDNCPPPWMIASQTCDISASGPGRQHPFVQVVPLLPVAALTSANRGNLDADRIQYLFACDFERTTSGGTTWCADLRLTVSISKALLLTRNPKDGFASEHRALAFAETVASKLRRPALAGVLTEQLRDSIDAHIEARGAGQGAFAKTEHVRIAVVLGERLSPASVSLLVIAKQQLDEAEEQLWRDWEEAGNVLLSQHNIVLRPTIIQTAADCPADVYRIASPIRLKNLPAPAWW